MKNHPMAVAVFVAIALTLTACGGSNNTSNPVPAAPAQIAGEYTGTVQDSVRGTGTAAITPLSQNGGSIGGTLALTYGNVTVNDSIALTLAGSGAISGSALGSDSSGNTCAFKVTGSYGSSNSQISGSYSAFSGCSGETGTFTLTQQCTDPVTTSHLRRTAAVPKC